MADSDPNDDAVDAAIKKVQAALDELKAAQRKDDADESDYDEADEPKENESGSMDEARIRVRQHFRARRNKASGY